MNDLEKGELTKRTANYLNELVRPLPDHGDRPVTLYGSNFEVDWHNALELEKLEGEQDVFHSEDSGNTFQLKRVLAPKVLSLKLNCPVILLKNMSQHLVNGTRGNVTDFHNGSPVVTFPHATVTLKKEQFDVFDPLEGTTVAECLQYPIKCALALAVHKAQGLTLPKVVVNCKQIYQHGQIGVAVGRAVSTSGVQVLPQT